MLLGGAWPRAGIPTSLPCRMWTVGAGGWAGGRDAGHRSPASARTMSDSRTRTDGMRCQYGWERVCWVPPAWWPRMRQGDPALRGFWIGGALEGHSEAARCLGPLLENHRSRAP